MKLGRLRGDGLRGLPSLLVVAGVLVGMAQLAFADQDYAEAWGPAVGSAAPLLAANDQGGNPQTVETLTGPNGLLVVFNRSVVW